MTGLIANQTYTGQSADYDGTTLTISGSSSESGVGQYLLTWTGTPDELTDAIYSAVINGYDVTYNNGADSWNNGGTGDNNVFSAITRDLLAGFNFGFINSETTSSLGVVGDLTSEQWMSLSYQDAFANAQTNADYYNVWAAAFAETFGDVYTFPFNDFLSGFAPEMNMNSGDTLTVTLLGYNAVPEPSSIVLLGIAAGLLCSSRRRNLRH